MQGGEACLLLGRGGAAAIRAAYLRLALAAHPDRHPTDPSAKAHFQALQWVYETLRDPDRRRLYDEGGGSAAMAGLLRPENEKFRQTLSNVISPEIR